MARLTIKQRFERAIAELPNSPQLQNVVAAHGAYEKLFDAWRFELEEGAHGSGEITPMAGRIFPDYPNLDAEAARLLVAAYRSAEGGR